MKKLLNLMIFLILLPFIFTGCSFKETNPNTQQDKANNSMNRLGQFTNADLSGEVTAVTGNEITIKVIEQPKFNERDTNQRRKEGERPLPQERDRNYTGETKTITVCEETTITTREINSGAKNITLQDIKVGDILQIHYLNEEKEVISQINITNFNKN